LNEGESGSEGGGESDVVYVRRCANKDEEAGQGIGYTHSNLAQGHGTVMIPCHPLSSEFRLSIRVLKWYLHCLVSGYGALGLRISINLLHF
jgi:hypothetical protein